MNQTDASNEVVLFVDDEANILSSLRRELHEWSKRNSIELRTAPSAREGMKFLEEAASRVAVIVSDLKMPEMLGSDFLLEVKATYPWIVTILLTGFSETQELMKAVRAGIFSYILKPWEPEYLEAELDKALETRHMRAAAEARTKAVEEELRWAGEMQRALMKPSLASTEGIEFRTSYRPLKGLYCSGDYYDVLGMGTGRYLLLIGDVAGHGVKAAFVTGILKAIIYPEYIAAAGGRSFSPAAFLSWLNTRMNFELRKSSGMIITFFAGLIDLQAGTFTYANAGQTHPFLIEGGAPRELPASGSSLGYAASVSYIDRVENIGSGDVLVAFTDGLVELRDPSGACHELSAADILAWTPYGEDFHKRLFEAALAAGGKDDFDDDVTVLSARLL
jgi:Serine phosphatase RsbU, regulator of sigma subunit